MKKTILLLAVIVYFGSELLLERQAFDAYMRINNGLDHIYLEDVKIDVYFSDENGASVLATSDSGNTDALFFIRVDSMENIDHIDGTGRVLPASSADVHWLIIPAPGASKGLEKGTLYYVGATLSYTIDGEVFETIVSPDYIFVKPMPELTLDYFLPTDVYGDDAFTPEIEPAIPFSLGVRVSNKGAGAVRNLKIESAQPKIVENEQGLLINFVIEGTEVNGEPAAPGLLADFGDIEPNRAGIARWIMTCSLSGEFLEPPDGFQADFSHSDELGGELTSLINDPVNTHTLVRDVLVDLTGRDSIKDFLAKDGSVYRVYESDNVDNPVINQSDSSTLSGSGDTYTLSTPVTAGFMYVQLSDPTGGQTTIKEVIRSDGKRMSKENVWLSKTRDDNHNWQYFFNLFDVDTTDSYTIVFQDTADAPQPPVLEFIPDYSKAEQEQLSFIVSANDPDGTMPVLSATPLPAGASFTDKEDGTGIFYWIPEIGQAGKYRITFTASDGTLKNEQRAAITIIAQDSDNDGMPDFWETKYFKTLEKDGTGDSDGDGISDIDEYQNNTNPVFIVIPGDVNNDGNVDMQDAILALKALVSIRLDDEIRSDADINGDGKIGTEEVIFILRQLL